LVRPIPRARAVSLMDAQTGSMSFPHPVEPP
jgi:hypothetical protein